MNARAVLRVLGLILIAVGAGMLPAAGLAAWDRSDDLRALLVSASVPLVVGGALLLLTRGARDLRLRDGFAVVTFGWLSAGILGGLPYLLSGAVTNAADAFFESISGFTTTGATIFTDIESLPRGILLWRSLTQWMGGMGIVVLSVAVLPMLGIGGMQLFRAEVPGPTADRLSPRIQSTAKLLWSLYVGLSAVEVALLMLGGMGWFDAVCHTFATMSTGGFSTRNASVGAFGNAYFDAVITVFMILAGANFSLHFWAVRGRLRQYFDNEEFRAYAWILGLVIAGLAVHLVINLHEHVPRSIQLAAFQVASIMTSTGFGTADYLLWGAGAQVLFFTIMFIGGCTGSTAGGLKVMRVVVLFKHGMRELQKQLHPNAIFNVRLSGKLVEDEIVMVILGFYLLYMSVFIVVALVVAMMGVDPITAFGASIATLSNIGPGLGEVGPAGNYAGLPSAAKVLLSFCMLLGRLELFTVLVVATPMFWRKT